MNKAMLVGNANDIENMTNFLITKCGFKPEEIQQLPNKSGQLCFHYQGKGCQAKKKRK